MKNKDLFRRIAAAVFAAVLVCLIAWSGSTDAADSVVSDAFYQHESAGGEDIVIVEIDERAMQGMGMIYPYWENAARVTENRCARLLLTAMILLVLPLVSLLVFIQHGLKRGAEGFSEKLFPRIKDGVEEAIRRPARRRWEKKHPGED